LELNIKIHYIAERLLREELGKILGELFDSKTFIKVI